MDELAKWDAVETAEKIRRGEVSAGEVCEAAITRAEAASELGAIVTPMFERARKGVRTLNKSAPLAGVPTAIKDLFEVKGYSTSWGSKGAVHMSTKSDPIVKRFDDAGFLALAKSSTPEFGLTATTEPLLGPVCRNPWNLEHSAGGSSGGAAALVASGVVPIAHASDGGGSIRIPASCCGLVGLKPSRRRLDMPGSNVLPINVAVHGCVSRTVRDTTEFWRSMGFDLDAPPAKTLRIGVYTKSGLTTDVDEDNQRVAREAAKLCEELGHHVEEIPCPAAGSLNDDFTLYWAMIGWLQVVGGKVLVHRDFDTKNVEPWTKEMGRFFRSQPLRAFHAVRRLRRFERDYNQLMERYDVLISPTLAAPPPKLGHLAPDLPWKTKLKRLTEYCPFTFVQNVTGAPAISLPLGQSAQGLPIGVQFGGRFGGEGTLLGLASSLEVAAPWASRRYGV
ncbi:MAG: amidase [Polyangiales bacterium]|jgi:amidase